VKHLWLVEDDPTIVDQLKPPFQSELGVAVTVIHTEEEFRRDYQGIASSSPPSVIVLDVMLRWTRHIVPAIPQPIDCRDYQRAGLRCRELIAGFPLTCQANVIFYSGLGRNEADLQGLRDPFLTKSSGHRNLIEFVKQILGGTAYMA
jgi:hypothetical protein